MPQKLARARPTFPLGTALFVAGMLLWAGAWWALAPSLSQTMLRDGVKNTPVSLPLQQNSGGKDVEIAAVLTVGPIHPTHYLVTVDDCLRELAVNGVALTDRALPVCNGPGTLDLGPRLHAGRNTLTARIRDDGGILVFSLAPSALDPLMILLLAAGVAMIGAYAVSLMQRGSRDRMAWLLAGTVTGGIALRIVYFLSTSYTVHAYDWDGHVEYVRYVAAHFLIPQAQKGWEFYQPPLYYFLTGTMMRAGQWIGRGGGQLLEDTRVISLALAIGGVLLGVWLGRLLFPEKRSRPAVALFAALLAAAPGLVFFSSRITNDTLFVPLSFLWFGTLLSWWKQGRPLQWHLSSVLLALCLLTKSNALPYLPIAFVCLAVRPGLRLRERVRLGLLGGGIIALLSGWIFVLRFLVERETFIVGNRLNGAMGVTNTPGHLLSFNPFRILAHPFNDNWNDANGRQYFWEYLFKSAVVGEWNFGTALRPLTLLLQLFRLLVLGLTAIGLVAETRPRWRRMFPVLLTLVILLGAALAYRVRSPFSANQDFRFIPLVIVPAAFYAVRGWQTLRAGLRRCALGLLLALLVTETIFLLLLCRG